MDLHSPSRILHSNLFALPNLSRETGTGCYTLLLRTPFAEPGKSSSGQPREAGRLRQSQAQAHRGRAAGTELSPLCPYPPPNTCFGFPSENRSTPNRNTAEKPLVPASIHLRELPNPVFPVHPPPPPPAPSSLHEASFFQPSVQTSLLPFQDWSPLLQRSN